MKELKIKLFPGGIMPRYAKQGDSGMDLFARLPDGPLRIRDGEAVVVPCGVALELEEGWEGQVRPRSGGFLDVRFGTIDSGYRGEIGARVRPFVGPFADIVDGDRIAQLVIAPVARVELFPATELSPSERGESGWHSTGSR